jgi:hypothetical protein
VALGGVAALAGSTMLAGYLAMRRWRRPAR